MPKYLYFVCTVNNNLEPQPPLLVLLVQVAQQSIVFLRVQLLLLLRLVELSQPAVISLDELPVVRPCQNKNRRQEHNIIKQFSYTVCASDAALASCAAFCAILEAIRSQIFFIK